MRRTSARFLIVIISLALIPIAPSVRAQEAVASDYAFEASIGQARLATNVSITAFNVLEIGLPANQLSAPTILKVNQLNETVVPPNGLSMSGPMYQIDMPAANFRPGRYFISIKSSGSDAYKQIYFFDKNHPGGWRTLPTNENFGKGIISTYLTAPFARLAVFENPKMVVKGKASWYRHKNGLFAASPDFPMGTRLRVINLDNKKSVDITVNDYGPNRTVHPDRVVDLDAAAFARLAPLGAGTIRVAVEKIPEGAAPAKTTATGEPNISSRAALILNSADNKVIWSDDADTVLPLASLTKLMAVKVFLDTKPDMKRVVAYSVKDEQMNAKYVNPAESARLRLADGDTVTVKDLVYSSLIGSTNNTVESLVRISGLKRAAFIARMNEQAKKLGATKTRFIEPTGLSPENVTTARDYAILAREMFMNPTIASVSVLPSYSLTTINTKKPHSFKNTNLLARESGADLLGSKTGYLTEAGYCLITKWTTPADKNVIIIVLGAGTRQESIDDTKALYEYAVPHIK